MVRRQDRVGEGGARAVDAAKEAASKAIIEPKTATKVAGMAEDDRFLLIDAGRARLAACTGQL